MIINYPTALCKSDVFENLLRFSYSYFSIVYNKSVITLIAVPNLT